MLKVCLPAPGRRFAAPAPGPSPRLAPAAGETGRQRVRDLPTIVRPGCPFYRCSVGFGSAADRQVYVPIGPGRFQAAFQGRGRKPVTPGGEVDAVIGQGPGLLREIAHHGEQIDERLVVFGGELGEGVGVAFEVLVLLGGIGQRSRHLFLFRRRQPDDACLGRGEGRQEGLAAVDEARQTGWAVEGFVGAVAENDDGGPQRQDVLAQMPEAVRRGAKAARGRGRTPCRRSSPGCGR